MFGFDIPYKLLGILLACGGIVFGVWEYGHAQRVDERNQLKAQTQAAENKYASARKDFDSETTAQQKEHALELGLAWTATKVVTNTIIKEVPIVITPVIVKQYPLPNGFVRLMDAAAADTTPSPGNSMDARPSGIGVDVATGVGVRNYGRFHQVVAALKQCRSDYDTVVKTSTAFATRIKSQP